MRIATIVIVAFVVAPFAMNASATPKNNAAPPASSNGRGDTPPDSSGPLAAITPTIAVRIPIHWIGVGCSPRNSPYDNGTTTPRAAIGEITPIVPEASAA